MLAITRADGKVNWPLFRRIFYVAIATWLVGVRLIGLDPFDDLVNGDISLSTLLDGLALYGVWLICWHLFWPNRPAVN
jgi:hypothetical protein